MNGDSTGKVVYVYGATDNYYHGTFYRKCNGGTVSVVRQYEVRPGDVFAGAHGLVRLTEKEIARGAISQRWATNSRVVYVYPICFNVDQVVYAKAFDVLSLPQRRDRYRNLQVRSGLGSDLYDEGWKDRIADLAIWDDPKEEWGGVNLDQFFVDEDFDRGCNYTGKPGSMRAGCPYLVRRQTRDGEYITLPGVGQFP